MYEKRLIDSILKEYVDELPAILLEGAKAVGKTETCKQLASTEYSMDNAAQRELLQNNPDIILQNSKPVLIDEWQLAPSLWSDVRYAVDDGLPNGSVLFTGSSIRVNSRVHSGAGRIIRLKLRPYSIEERNLSDSYIRIADLFNFDSKATVNGETDKTLVDYLDEISPRPILFIVGDRAHSKFFSEEAFNKASEPKELYVVDDAEHIDLYDKIDKIPFDKLELFFKNNLK